MFNSFAWTPALFVVAVVVSIIGYYFSRVIGFVLLLAFVLYVGINWQTWAWVAWVFWIVWGLGLAGYILWVVFTFRRHRYTRHSGWVANGASYVALGITLVMVIASLLSHVNWSTTKTVAIPSPTTSTSSSPSPTTTTATPKPTATAACPDTWEIKPADHGDNRWFANGIASIRAAKTPAQAAIAAQDWVHRVEADSGLLSGALKFFLNKDVSAAQLTTGKCASDTAKSLATQLELTLDSAKSITPGVAPSNGTNSGVDHGKVVSATTAGITGDRKAIEVVLSNGTVIWIMARCGNPVVEGQAPVPPGKTEKQQLPPATVTSSPPPGVPFFHKPPQTWNCMVQANAGCKPNVGHQTAQNNTTSGVNTGGTPGAPAQAPAPAPAQTTAPSGGSTGPSGTTTGGTQPTNSPSVGVTGTPTSNVTPPSGG